MSRFFELSAVALVIFAMVMCGCTAQPAQTPGPVAPVETTGQALQGDPPGPVATVTPEDSFKPATTQVNGKEIPYLYSTARGLKPHPEGFVCHDPNPTWIGNENGPIGIWCER